MLKIFGLSVNWLIFLFCLFFIKNVSVIMIVKVILDLFILIVKIFINGFVIICGNGSLVL